MNQQVNQRSTKKSNVFLDLVVCACEVIFSSIDGYNVLSLVQNIKAHIFSQSLGFFLGVRLRSVSKEKKMRA